MGLEKRGITAEDLYRIRYVSDPQLSPNAKTVVYVQTGIDEQKESRSHLYVQSLEGEAATAITEGQFRDSFPRWSPDGSKLIFVSNRSGRPQLWLISDDGGELVQLTHCKHGATHPVWSPDGKKILFSTSLAPGESFTDKEGEKVEDASRKTLVVTRIKYKSDEHGFLHDKNKHLAILHLETGDIVPLTDGPYDHSAGTWSPDGKWVAITASRCEQPDQHVISDVYLVSVEGRELKKLTESKGEFSQPTWSPDGKKLAYIGSESAHTGAAVKKIWVTDVESGERNCVTSSWDVHVGDTASGDMRSSGHAGVLLWADGKGMYVIASERGKTGIYHVTLDGEVSQLVGGARNIYGVSLDADRQSAIIAVSDTLSPGDLFLVNLSTGEERRLTDVNRDLLEEIELSAPEEIEWEAPDGWQLHGWMMKPIGYQQGHKYPMILEIHGGPHAMYANTFFHEFQMLAAKGYAVLFTNPRGSHGYGETFVKACCGDYGGKDYLDLMSAVDYAVSRFDFIDENRLGVTGGSYGGFMTNWIVGHTNRFRAAVTDRSISNWLSFSGVSDIGYTFTPREIEGDIFTDAEKLWYHSPLKYAANVETPLLIMHGERDFRCPIEQAEQLFIALSHKGKPVSFIRFPDANHEMSRSGDPQQRILRLKHMADWFESHI